MKKKTLAFLGAGLMVAAGIPFLIIQAAEVRSGDAVQIQNSETISDDMYAAGGTITSAGRVQGDLYAGGGTILVTGPVAQDAVLGGGTITITSAVGDDVRVGGGTIVVQGAVGGDVVAGGGQIHLAGSGIRGDVVAGGGVVRLEAPVEGSVRMGGGELYINGPIRGNVELNAEKITVGANAVITGSFTYTSPTEAIVEEGAQIGGAIRYEPRPGRDDGKAVAAAIFSAFAVAKFFMALAGAFFFGLVFRRYVGKLVANAHERPLLEFGRGFIGLIVIPVASVLLMVTVVGIPLGVVGILGYVGGIIISCLIAPVLLGALLYRWLRPGELLISWQSILLGVLAYTLIGIVPILGGLVQLALMVITFGAMLGLKWEIAREWR